MITNPINDYELLNEQQILVQTQAQNLQPRQIKRQIGRPSHKQVGLKDKDQQKIIESSKYYSNQYFRSFLKEFLTSSNSLIGKPQRNKKYLLKNKKEMRKILQMQYNIPTNQSILYKLDNFPDEITKQQVQEFIFEVGDILYILRLQYQ